MFRRPVTGCLSFSRGELITTRRVSEKSPPSSLGIRVMTGFACCLFLVLTSCGQEMENQRRVESQEQTDIFPDDTASRAVPEHAIVASDSAVESVSAGPTHPNRRWLKSADKDDAGGYLTGKNKGQLVNTIPDQVLERYDYETLIFRGRERFNISCVPCHDQTGSGNGMVARRGLKFPPSYHTDRLRNQPLGYIFNVATNGRGQMPAYGDFLSTDDRWAIAAYVRTLQFSQYAPTSELTEADLKQTERYEAESGRASTQNKAGGSQ